MSSLPKDEIDRAMKELCWFQARPLCQLIEQRVPVVRASKTDPALWLDRLAAIFQHAITHVDDCNDSHPCLGAINEVNNHLHTYLLF